MRWTGWLALVWLAGCSTLQATPPVAPLPSDVAFAWPSVLQDAVDGQGRVDFRRLSANRGALEIAVAAIAETAPNNAPLEFPTRAEQLAFHINAYNTLAMYALVRSGIPGRLSPIDRADLFKLTRFVVGGRAMSLAEYEDDLIRPLQDERVHFALNCMAVSCPRLPQVPFRPVALYAALDTAARFFLNEPRNVQVDPSRRVVRLSSILDVHAPEFRRRAPSLIAYVNLYRDRAIPTDYNVEFIPFDWTINAQPSQ